MRTRITIKGFPNYEIDSSGIVWSKNTGKPMNPWLANSGYLMVALRSDGVKYRKYIHRLVAEAFIDGDHEGLEINHIDGNKLNNFIENLEWCTHSKNTLHAIKNGLFTPYKLPPYTHGTKKVEILETGEVFNSLTECAKHISGNKTGISACLRDRAKSYKGYHFKEVK